MSMIELLERAKTAEMAAGVSSHLPMVAVGKHIEADVFRHAYSIATKQAEKDMKYVFDRAMANAGTPPELLGELFQTILGDVINDSKQG
jgi:hypothetical protein